MDSSDMTEVEKLRALLALHMQLNEVNDKLISQLTDNLDRKKTIIKLLEEQIEILKRSWDKALGLLPS